MSDDRTEVAGMSAGALFRQEREAQQLSVEEVAAQLKISQRLVRALEEDRHDALPGLTFVRGFARNYARLLNLDEARVMALLPAIAIPREEKPARDEAPASEQRIAYTETQPAFGTRHPVRLKTLFLLVAAVFVLGGIAALLTRSGVFTPAPKVIQTPPATPPQAAPAPPPVAPASPAAAVTPPDAATQTALAAAPADAPTTAAPPSDATPPAAMSTTVKAAPDAATAPGSGHHVQVSVSDDAWIKLSEANGHTLFAGVLKAGDQREFDGTPPLHVIVGNAPATQILYNGRPVKLSGSSHDKVDRITLE